MPLDREKWLAERRKMIGGSDVAAILGLSKWRTALEVYKDKIGDLPVDHDMTDAQEAGLELQRPIIDRYCRDQGAEIVAYEPEIVRHPDYPFIGASLDAVVKSVHDDEWNVDAKRVNWRRVSEWGEEGSDRMPDDAFYQGHQQNFVTGRHRTDFAVALGGDWPPRVYTVPADKEFFELLLPTLEQFWQCVKTGQEPAPDFAHETTAVLMKRLYPDVDPAKKIALAPSYAELAERYWLLGQLGAMAEKRRELLKGELLFAIGDAVEARIEGSPIVFKRSPIPGGAVVHFVKAGYVRFDAKFPKGHQHEITVAKAAPLLAAEGETNA